MKVEFKLGKHFVQQVFWAGLCSLSLLTAPVFAAESSEPQQAIETFLATIQSMNFPVQNLSTHQTLAAKADAFLDLETLSKKALESHWDSAGPEFQKTFLELMMKLIESVAYPKSHRFMGQFEITYPKVEKSGSGFAVHSIIKKEEEALDATVVYHLYQKGGQWKVDDIVLDDVSIAEDLKYQFDRIIQEFQYSGLLDKMREKLTRAEKDNQIR